MCLDQNRYHQETIQCSCLQTNNNLSQHKKPTTCMKSVTPYFHKSHGYMHVVPLTSTKQEKWVHWLCVIWCQHFPSLVPAAGWDLPPVCWGRPTRGRGGLRRSWSSSPVQVHKHMHTNKVPTCKYLPRLTYSLATPFMVYEELWTILWANSPNTCMGMLHGCYVRALSYSSHTC